MTANNVCAADFAVAEILWVSGEVAWKLEELSEQLQEVWLLFVIDIAWNIQIILGTDLNLPPGNIVHRETKKTRNEKHLPECPSGRIVDDSFDITIE